MSRSPDQDYDLHIKLLMLGDTGVGKTCLLLRYAYDSFSPTFITTIGIDFKIKHTLVDGVHVKMQIWDTAGQERFRTITVSYFKGAHGVILVYDVTDRDTFENIRHWLAQIKKHADRNVCVLLIGNKSDKSQLRMVSREEGEALAKDIGVQFYETSAKGNINVEESFMSIAKNTKRNMDNETKKVVKLEENRGVQRLEEKRKKPGGGGGCC